MNPLHERIVEREEADYEDYGLEPYEEIPNICYRQSIPQDYTERPCSEIYNCCDCGGNECGCAYCWSCNACEVCIDERLTRRIK